ncbi:MAG: FAD-binding protein [Deltaproteobacteria bacterium]|nr:FAD-binding protein [Deltaproteobacteria bacterium]MBW1946547.1 FAD-binding protein [Deltaproteobacteria bacterium]MBW1966096.1 FAD-binding protein [Deltaproteobacteria bacterium]MBW2097645.1 FAD-binding protein [Deltaproteobacteria bacterium]
MKKVLVRRFLEIVGPGNFSTDPADLKCYSYDASSISSLPEAVVLPGSTEEVSRVLFLANQEGLAVFPRGAGTGTTGASVPINGGLVLSLTRMDRIISINPADLTAMVEPGVVTGKLQEEVSRYGLFYPPDPASMHFCTIGGNVATGAGGPRAVKYGVTRDYVLALEIVLADGNVIHTGVRTAKGVVGYDLTRLMVGSEGTLGVVTGITLKLIPGPEAEGMLIAFFPDAKSASDTVVSLFESRILPRCAEFLDKMSIELISGQLPVAIPERADAMLLIEVDGVRESIPGQLGEVVNSCKNCGAIDIHVAESDDQAKAFWSARQGLSPSIRSLGFPDKINEDICVPRSCLPEMINELEKIGRKTRITILSFGHAGDGNLHVNLLLDLSDKEEKLRGDAAVMQIMEATLALGGTISGEHGIGLTKRPFIKMEIDDRGLEIMRGIKRIFDPGNILNPGKVFP